MVSFTLNIKDKNWDLYKEGFLEKHPVPVNPQTQEPLMSENDWVKEKLRSIAVKESREGWNKKRNSLAAFNENIVE